MNKMSRKVTASSAKATLAANKAAANSRNKSILNPTAPTSRPVGINRKENLKVSEMPNLFEKDSKTDDCSKILSSSMSSGNNSSNGGDLRQKSKIIKYKDGRTDLQEIESLYDDYLVSELMRMNAENNCNETCKKINDEVLDMWSSIEMLRGEVLKIQETNELSKRMLEFYNAADSESPNISSNIDSKLPETSRKLKELAYALEQSRHHLKVLGATIDPNEDTDIPLLKVLNETLAQLSIEYGERNTFSYGKTASQMSKLNNDLENSISAFDDCKELLKRLKTSTLHAASLMLSKQTVEDSKQDEVGKEFDNDFNFTKCAMEEIIHYEDK